MKHRFALISIPYLSIADDASTQRNIATFRFSSIGRDACIDRRRVKREIRKWVKHNLERNLHCLELRQIMKNVLYTQ